MTLFVQRALRDSSEDFPRAKYLSGVAAVGASQLGFSPLPLSSSPPFSGTMLTLVPPQTFVEEWHIFHFLFSPFPPSPLTVTLSFIFSRRLVTIRAHFLQATMAT